MAADWSDGDSLVSMMQTADLRDFHDPSCFRGLNCPADGRVFAQRQMSSRSLVVAEVRPRDSAQAAFIQDDLMSTAQV